MPVRRSAPTNAMLARDELQDAQDWGRKLWLGQFGASDAFDRCCWAIRNALQGNALRWRRHGTCSGQDEGDARATPRSRA
jgi:hypothetical protein